MLYNASNWYGIAENQFKSVGYKFRLYRDYWLSGVSRQNHAGRTPARYGDAHGNQYGHANCGSEDQRHESPRPHGASRELGGLGIHELLHLYRESAFFRLPARDDQGHYSHGHRPAVCSQAFRG